MTSTDILESTHLDEEQTTVETINEELGILKEDVAENEKKPINDFIKDLKQGPNKIKEIDIAFEAIKSGYSWEDIMNSSLDDESKENLKTHKKNIYLKNSFRFSNEHDFENIFLDVAKETLNENCSFESILKKYRKLQRAVTKQDIILGWTITSQENGRGRYKVDLSGEELDDFNRRNPEDPKDFVVFHYLAFDNKTFSRTKPEHLPEGYDPIKVFEYGKSIGLGIDLVRKKWGYTGNGVSAAICDWKFPEIGHENIHIDSDKYKEEGNAKVWQDSGRHHSLAVTSILTGRDTGIAPDATLHFYAEYENKQEKDGGSDLKSALLDILEKNKQLADNEKIRVVSISGPLYGDGIDDVVKELEDSGVWVLSSDEFFKDFGYLEKKDPTGDPNDFNNYQHCLGNDDALFVNSGDRTLADQRSTNAYRHDSHPSASWAIPVVAGYYVLACQADPTMTPIRFKELAGVTATEIDSTIRKDEKERSKETKKIKVINIFKLIEKIEEDRISNIMYKKYYI